MIFSQAIPEFMIRSCEAVEDAHKHATAIHDIVNKANIDQANGEDKGSAGDKMNEKESSPPEKKAKLNPEQI